MHTFFHKLSIVILLAGCVCACTEDPALEVSPTQLNQYFDVVGGVKYVTVVATGDFTATSDQSWCVPDVYPGGREYNLAIIVEKNDLANERTATVTVAADGLPAVVITVAQTGAGPVISVRESLAMVDDDNLTFTLQITANLPFTYELPDWIQLQADNTPAIGTRLYGFVAMPLPAGETERDGSITIKPTDAAIDLRVTIPVKQTRAINPFDGVAGRWQFEDAADIGKATVGRDLIIFESSRLASGATETGGPMSLVTGPKITDYAVRVPQYSYFKCEYVIAANGGGNRVNEYTMMFDFKVPALSKYYTFFNTYIGDGNDGSDNSTNADFFIRNTNVIGGGVFSYSPTSNPIEANRWYRLVVSVKVGDTVKYYLDGELFFTSTNLSTVDNFRASLRTDAVLFFNDDSGEDNQLDIAEVAIWDEA
ncbi:MAG: hypothetical protein LBD91_02250, partial [Prevotellaceae bacterium]|nr:hypothetical protein [Prevotellaceae bacterium]